MCKPQNKTGITYELIDQPEKLGEQFYAISNESYMYGSPWSISQFEETFDQPHLFYIIALMDKEMIGFLGASIIQREAEIYNIAVANSHKRKGAGSGLIQELKYVLTMKQAKGLYLEVRVSNEAAILLYKKLDFHPVGVRPHYYSNPKEDAVVLKCEL